ncbi:CBN-SODH-2 protein [Aphelenchoides fujianensis]|nr:CBN-SODH-2 protein [Aphelenchoides fujianensis]
MGFRPLAIDGSSKEKICKEMGAEWFVDFKTEDLVEKIRKLTDGGCHGVICMAPNQKPMEAACEYVRTRGTVVLVALPKDAKVSIDVFSTVFRAITVKGSYVGNRQDTIEAIDFFNRGLIKIPMEVEPLSQLSDVFKRMQSGEINGRIVLDLWK